jgi:hypothetical protein
LSLPLSVRDFAPALYSWAHDGVFHSLPSTGGFSYPSRPAEVSFRHINHFHSSLARWTIWQTFFGFHFSETSSSFTCIFFSGDQSTRQRRSPVISLHPMINPLLRSLFVFVPIQGCSPMNHRRQAPLSGGRGRRFKSSHSDQHLAPIRKINVPENSPEGGAATVATGYHEAAEPGSRPNG